MSEYFGTDPLARIAFLEAENAKLRELLKQCRAYIAYDAMQILENNGVPVEHIQLIQEIDLVIGPLPGGE